MFIKRRLPIRVPIASDQATLAGKSTLDHPPPRPSIGTYTSRIEPLESRTLLSASPAFLPAVQYQTGLAPVAIGAGDFDLDGKIDIVTANFVGSSLSVELGNEIANTIGGNQGRDATIDTPLGGRPFALAVGDYNGDGKADVAVIEQFTTFSDAGGATLTNKLFFLRGLGDGHFAPPVECDGSVRPAALITADLNGRGDQIVVADSADGSVDVFQGSRDGVFTHMAYAAGGRTGSVRLATGDFNGDGKADVVTVAESDGTASFLLGTVDGLLLPAVHVATGVSQVSSITAGDFNSPNKAELVVASSGDGSVRTFDVQGFAGGGDTSAPSVHAALIALLRAVQTSRTDYGNPITGVQAGDFTGDGKLDLAVGSPFSNLAIQAGRGDGAFDGPAFYNNGRRATALTAGDFNGDGTTDVAVAQTQQSTVTVILNSPTTSLSVIARPIFGQRGVPLANVRVASFSDVLYNAPPGYYAAIIDWGDGTVTSGVVALAGSPSNFNVFGTHTYATAGQFAVKVTIKPSGGVGASVTDSANIGTGLQLGGAVKASPKHHSKRHGG